MNKSESIKEIAKALINVQKEMPAVKKDSTNPFYKSKYAGLETVMPLALKALTDNEIAVTQTVGGNEQGSTLTTLLMHVSGEWIEDTQPLLLVKSDPQGQGSAITYARRYGLMSFIGMVADEDDDGNKASGEFDSNSGLKVEHNSKYRDIEARIKSAVTFQDVNDLLGEIRTTPMAYNEKKNLTELANTKAKGLKQ